MNRGFFAVGGSENHFEMIPKREVRENEKQKRQAGDGKINSIAVLTSHVDSRTAPHLIRIISVACDAIE